jgi:hypothetical protein
MENFINSGLESCLTADQLQVILRDSFNLEDGVRWQGSIEGEYIKYHLNTYNNIFEDREFNESVQTDMGRMAYAHDAIVNGIKGTNVRVIIKGDEVRLIHGLVLSKTSKSIVLRAAYKGIITKKALHEAVLKANSTYLRPGHPKQSTYIFFVERVLQRYTNSFFRLTRR